MADDVVFSCVTLVVKQGEAEDFTLTISPFDDMEGVKKALARAMDVERADEVVLTGSFGIVTLDVVLKSITAYLKTAKHCIILDTEYTTDDVEVRNPERRTMSIWIEEQCLSG